ncbi:type II toxin-antitoxin system RelE/ParE family toxin [Ectopseudomonas oleovorans]|uniref:type II toxin-antitoxin system RelE/ParE family toxin n=1 Tax=Ectopseudomonas oleovorans TaxID=301 RepID=UPI0019D24221|nr:type II toxin-antitoxin system RelE/ParE family toxin [Pseudomonas oleovorans]
MTTYRTVAETDIFQRQATEVWSSDELLMFKTWLAQNPEAGDVVPGGGGVRKVRWSRPGMGKRAGARVIYFNEHEGRIWLLTVYVKAKFDNLPAEFLKRLKDEVEHD